MKAQRLFTTLAGVSLFASAALAQSKPTVAVLYFNNSATGKANEELAPLSKGIADILIQELAANSGIRVVERDQLQKALDEQKLGTDGKLDNETAVKVGKLLGAKHMVTGGFITDRSGTMVLSVRVFDTETSQIEYTTSGSNKIDNVFALVNSVAGKINKGLKLPDIPKQLGDARQAQAEKVPYQAVMLYSRGLNAKDAGKKAEAVTLFKQTLDKFPEYQPAKDELKKLGS